MRALDQLRPEAAPEVLMAVEDCNRWRVWVLLVRQGMTTPHISFHHEFPESCTFVNCELRCPGAKVVTFLCMLKELLS